MKTKTFRLAFCIVVAVALSCAAARTNAQSQDPPCETCRRPLTPAFTTGVAYSQPHNLSGTLYLSASAENDYDQFVWDDFTLPIDALTGSPGPSSPIRRDGSAPR